MREYVALRTIGSVLAMWEKMRDKLDKAITTLNTIITENKEEIKKLETKNKDLTVEIQEAEKFKSNINKMFE
jgi:prefoldin subunit 5